LDWNSNPMFYANPLLQKNVQSDMNYIFEDPLLHRAARALPDDRSKARANEGERTRTPNDMF